VPVRCAATGARNEDKTSFPLAFHLLLPRRIIQTPRAIADILDEFRVITYDRRASARSTMNEPQNFEISLQSRDAVAVLRAAGETSTFVFGNSNGPNASPLAKRGRFESESQPPSHGTAWLRRRSANSAIVSRTSSSWCIISSRHIRSKPCCQADWMSGFAASMTPWHKELAHSQFAEDRMVLAVPKGHPLARRERIRLRDLQDMPFIWFQRWVNPAFYDQMMQAVLAVV
jgi:hypothetical protein